ncbi:MAG: allantoinase AllB [Bacteroidetes bacterium]|nr:allantoinase AllB [Bacteroidota bacterium]
MSKAIALYSQQVLLPEGVKEATLFMDGGVITEILPGMSMEEGVELVNVGSKVVMPGVIDPHVHINEPGRTDWEGFETAGLAAVAGGITMLVDMPLNSSPVTTTVEAFDQKRAAAAGKVRCDCGFWGGVVPGNAGEIGPLIERGVLGFKAFLTHSGIDEFPNVKEDDLRKVMPVIAGAGLPLLVHCELEDGGAFAFEGNPRSYRRYLMSRPASWEDEAIALMIKLCEEYKCRVHIVHLSSASSIPQIRRAKERGLPLTVETAPHYLYFSAEGIADGATYFKCAPPIREKVNNDLLWEALREGVIDFVATDHSPAPPILKMAESGDFTRAWGGISSLQLLLPVVWTAASQRGFGLEDMVKWLCRKPAELAGVSEERGSIVRGYRADLVVWDEGRRFRVEESGLYHRHKGTPYLGEELLGVVEQTWLGGERVFGNS